MADALSDLLSASERAVRFDATIDRETIDRRLELVDDLLNSCATEILRRQNLRHVLERETADLRAILERLRQSRRWLLLQRDAR
jgi:hypothetical protein